MKCILQFSVAELDPDREPPQKYKPEFVRVLSFLNKVFGPRARTVLMFGPAPKLVPMSARSLLGNPAFRDAFLVASEVVERERGWSPFREIDNNGAPAGVSLAERKFIEESVLQLCLYRAFIEKAPKFDAVAGISIGDVVAAHAAGAFDFHGALRVLFATSGGALRATGGDLIAVHGSPETVAPLIGDENIVITIDWPGATVLAVPDARLARVQRKLRVAGIPSFRLNFNSLCHTDTVDIAGVEQALAGLPELSPSIPYYSTYEGGRVPDAPVTHHRWGRTNAEPVRLYKTWQQLKRDGLTDVIYFGSVPADTDFFATLPKSDRPTSFKRAESFIDAGSPRKSVAVKEDIVIAPSDFEEAMRTRAFAADPFPYYRKWIAEGAVHKLRDDSSFIALSYDAATIILKDSSVFSAAPLAELSPILAGADPPIHTRVRRTLMPYFARERVLSRSDSINEVTRQMIGHLKSKKSFDFTADFAILLPFRIQCALLGVTETGAAVAGQLRIREATWADIEGVLLEDGVFPELIRKGDLERDEVVKLFRFLIGAGVSTMRDQFSTLLFTLMREPDIRERLAADMSLMPFVIEEMIRYNPAVHGDPRLTRVDTTVAGVPIPAGSTVWVLLAAANRDASRFADPDKFVIGRQGERHIGFGAGAHYCLGQHLARLELEIVLRELLPVLPGIKEIDEPVFEFNGIHGAGRDSGEPLERRISSWRLSFH